MTKLTLFITLACALLTGCSRTAEKAPEETPAAPANFKVRFNTTKGPFIMEVHRDWAPIGVDRFYQLVKDKFYDGAAFFRVVPGFVVQFGLAADPAMTKKWDVKIADDPVRQTNRAGMVSFATAGPNTRTTQAFINLGNNQRLDGMGFAPFAEVTQGMDIVQKLFSGYGEAPNQDMITNRGSAYLKDQFPMLDTITSTEVIQ